MSYTATYDPDTDFDSTYTRAAGRRIRRWLRPGDGLLEYGCATGLMTSLFAGRDVTVTAIDHAEEYLQVARSRGLAFADFICTPVEGYDPGRSFEHIVATNLLSELLDPAAFMGQAREQLGSGGMLHVTINNPRSLHRLLALEIGLIDELDAKSDRGERYLSRRLLDMDALARLGADAGLVCVHREPLLLKPLPNDQMAELPRELVDGFERVARHFPENGAMNYAIFVADE